MPLKVNVKPDKIRKYLLY